jgi:hypothetical protein
LRTTRIPGWCPCPSQEEFVQEFKILVVVREESRLFPDGPAEMNGVLGPQQPEGAREQHVVSRPAEKLHGQSIETIVVQIDSHRWVSRWRSSGERSRGEGWYL